MAVTVTPATFTLVYFDAAAIAAVAAGVAERLGVTADLVIEVDEASPLPRVWTTPGDPIAIRVESGAFEDTRRPRHQSDEAVARSVGRALLRLLDRFTGFAAAPDDADLTLAQAAAWDTYVIGRLHRRGWPQHEQRWRYNFRNRHGFTDAADAAFDRLWAADNLTWDQLVTISDQALAARAA